MSRRDLERATLGGGCFWCLEALYELVRGVERVESGYAGGHVADPTYRQVCSGTTGHAEVVQVHFDPTVVSYEEILRIFFAGHDPTTLNRQGPDEGTQYRSVILYESEEQKAIAERVIADLTTQGVFDQPIVTEVARLQKFYPAEAYHQGYFRRHPDQSYCQFVIAPKVAKFRKEFASYLKS